MWKSKLTPIYWSWKICWNMIISWIKSKKEKNCYHPQVWLKTKLQLNSWPWHFTTIAVILLLIHMHIVRYVYYSQTQNEIFPTNIYVLLRLRMQNQRKKWNFLPNFRNGIIWTAPFPLNIRNGIIACALGLQKHLFWYSLKMPAFMIIFQILFSQKHCTLY